jgi:YNFM family putative membrane transporter
MTAITLPVHLSHPMPSTSHPLPTCAPVTQESLATEKLQFGTPAYRRTARAMFVGGFSTFSMLYCVQPLLPVFSQEFHLSPAMASGAVSAATGSMALMLIPASILADRYGRRPVMTASLALSSLFLLSSTLCSAFWQLLLLRALLGISLAGLPAVAMAYLSEEIEARSLGRSLGLYIAGNALGGMCGRLFAASLSDWVSWRFALGLLGVLAMLGALEFWRCLPVSRHFTARQAKLGQLVSSTRRLFQDAGLPWLFLCGFLLMGGFVSLYNVLGYRLEGAPFHLRPSQEGLIFTLYLVGTFGSTWAGKLADRVGRRNVLWIMVLVMASGLAMTLSISLALMVLGIGIFTFGFFGGHAVASSWIGLRSGNDKALASALYLGFYYLGSSVLGALSGGVWSVAQWPGLVLLLLLVLLGCMGVALHLRRLPPLAHL